MTSILEGVDVVWKTSSSTTFAFTSLRPMGAGKKLGEDSENPELESWWYKPKR